MTDKPDTSPIEAVSFTPLSDESRPERRPLKRATVIVAALALVAAAILWLIFSSKALLVITDPASADVEISGGLVIPVGDSHLVRPGDYSLTVSAPGYHDVQQTIEVTGEGDTRVAVTLEKLPGKLQVRSEINEVAVTVDGKFLGTAPGTFGDIPPGGHKVVLSHPRYRPQEQVIEFRGMDNVEELGANLMPAWGQIRLESEPAGASITVGDTTVGETPATIDVLESGERVSLSLPGHKTWQKTLRARPGESAETVKVTLAPADASVKLTTRPAGARITVNGEFQGQTPTTLYLEPNRPQRITLFLAGYKKETRTLHLKRGEEKGVDVDLTPELGDIRITVIPENAAVFVDGKPVSPGTALLSLPARQHKIEARLTGYVSQTQTITPRPGVEQNLALTLVRESDAKREAMPSQIVASSSQILKRFPPEPVTFTTGSSRREQGRRANEIRRDVTLARLFYLATSPVTNAQFKKFSPLHSSSHANRKTLDTPGQPVVNITWHDAALYCNWLSEQEGLPLFYQVKGGKVTGFNRQSTGYRLPTETEWAYAARYRNGTMLKFPWGEQFPPPAGAGNYADNSANGFAPRLLPGYQDGFPVSAPVAHFPANDKGIYDLSQNVSEWVHDYYGAEPSLGTKAETDPVGPGNGEYHVIRGASWRQGTITELRLSFRDYSNEKRSDLGFRIARYAVEVAP